MKKILSLIICLLPIIANAEWKISGLAAMECSTFLETKTLDNETAKNFISQFMLGYIDGVNSANYAIYKDKMKVVALPGTTDQILGYVTQQCLIKPKQSLFSVAILYARSLTTQ